MKKIRVEISTEGIFGFYEDLKEILPRELLKEAKKNRKRVSYIYPANPIKRFFFKLIRTLVEDESPIAEWTRRWKGDWIVIIDNEVKGRFKSRDEAVSFEKDYLFKKFEKRN